MNGNSISLSILNIFSGTLKQLYGSVYFSVGLQGKNSRYDLF